MSRWESRARELVGGRPSELAEWAHEAKIKVIEAALEAAYQQGRADVIASAKEPPGSGWAQCNQCGNGYACSASMWEVDHHDRMACPCCRVGFLSWKPWG